MGSALLLGSIYTSRRVALRGDGEMGRWGANNPHSVSSTVTLRILGSREWRIKLNHSRYNGFFIKSIPTPKIPYPNIKLGSGTDSELVAIPV